jgi:membrane-bound lytic murein transglycosylase C
MTKSRKVHKMIGRLCLPMLFIPLFLFACLFLHRGAWGQEDLEREFFKSVEGMEKEYKDFEQSAFEQFQREVQAMWQDFVVSTKKDWVEYSGDKTGRTRVDFESGEVQVEVLVPKKQAEKDPTVVMERLAQEIERLADDKGKNRDYPLPAETEIEVPVAVPGPPKEIPPAPLLSRPVLEDQLQTKAGQPVAAENKKAFALEILEAEPVKEEVLETEKGEMVKAQVAFALVPDHLRIRAEKYLASVRKEANRFEIPVPLAFAVMHTESYFNPKARSPVPAYGLMQLVPKSGARDAYRFVHGEERILPADYLYVPANNVELGCAYLGLLKNHYFKNMKSSESALYCAMASYNTGPGNLSRALVGVPQMAPAIERVNTMDPEEVYTYLRAHLPYEETRDYIKKVRDRMSLYKEWE